MTFSDEARERQWARAEEITRTLTGGRTVRGIVAAMYALVVADERPGANDSEPKQAPAAGARQVLKPSRVAAEAAGQGMLW